MPTGPQGQKRPADAIQSAVMIGKLATGELSEDLREPTQRFKGGKARAEALPKAKRKAIAKKAAKARWS